MKFQDPDFCNGITNSSFLELLQNPAYLELFSNAQFNAAMQQNDFLYKLDAHVLAQLADKGAFDSLMADDHLWKAIGNNPDLFSAFQDANLYRMINDQATMSLLDNALVMQAMSNGQFIDALGNELFRAAYSSSGFSSALSTALSRE
jgi:hypothetical protein